jgi:hypothetical protein
MPIIDADDLRAVLGVSVSMYSDAYLDQIIASSEQICLPLLTAYQSAVDSYKIVDDVVYFYTIRSNFFVQGQSVIVTGCGDADGTYTVDARTSNTYMFSAGLVAADTLSTIPVIPAGIAVLDGSSAADLYANTDAIKNALLGLSTDIFQAIIAPGSQIEGVDFAQTIYRTGRSMINRQFGLLAPYIDTETICQ